MKKLEWKYGNDITWKEGDYFIKRYSRGISIAKIIEIWHRRNDIWAKCIVYCGSKNIYMNRMDCYTVLMNSVTNTYTKINKDDMKYYKLLF
jgi:hypothetical protein